MPNVQATYLKKLIDAAFFMKDEPQSETGPSWKFRRQLIFGSYRLGFAMIVFGALTFLVDQWGVGVTLITGGVSLISIITTAYTVSASWQDTKIVSNEWSEDV
jgi:fructose-1,6-bisphosphatase/inositol monophosphatase family enzyme